MAVALVTLGGFGMIFGLVIALITRGINLSPSGMFWISFSLLVILAIDWLLVRQLSRVLNVPQLSSDATQAKKPKLTEQAVRQIDEPREPVSSVTEHTTRTFEPIYRESDIP
jgi:membrane protein implicated in regulation of membrane protease activity